MDRLESTPLTNSKNKVRKVDYVLSTIIISYRCKKTGDPKYTYTKVEDMASNLFNTRHVVYLVGSTDKYQIENIEYELEPCNFTDFDSEVSNILH